MPESPDAAVIISIDDQVPILELIQVAIDDGGYVVRAATTSEEAIALLEVHHAGDLDGLVTDVNLGGSVSGWDVAVRSRELRPDLPVVYVTGDSGHERASRGVPGSVLVHKPFAPAQIVVALASLANQAEP
jgi:CheY-like chemotaxis protein